jgi:hypothetical protein
LLLDTVLESARKLYRGIAQPGSACRSGRQGRRFKSSRPDSILYFIQQAAGTDTT